MEDTNSRKPWKTGAFYELYNLFVIMVGASISPHLSAMF